MGERAHGMLFQGATIASAPSVEQEDYRTPKPSFDKNGGKSFDCCAPTGSLASDSNGLVKVSARFSQSAVFEPLITKNFHTLSGPSFSKGVL